ncbi:MAG TPA: M23 family metallopeptidase [Luteitalea sp.]|nr:M23 family metallopeptidase [Luteitalea sp.]
MGLDARVGRVAVVAAWLAMSMACATSSPLSRLTRESSPYEQYVDGLRDAGLDGTALGRDWLQAGEQALTRPAPVTLPLAESGYFEAATPSAAAWRFDLPRGRRLVVDVQLDAAAPARLFVDLFTIADDGTASRVRSLPAGSTTLTYDAERDGVIVVRVQPELLRRGRYTLTQRTLASLAFPVQGLTARAVQSAFGAERDAGRRTHEGLDIFAARGTPVLAVGSGIARPDTNALGGTVVWLHQPDADRTFYYAHLERWAFESAQMVTAGDVLGYVGNTGNARTTSPHLHFGIYSRGAVDPAPYLREDDPVPVVPPAPLLGTPVRVTTTRATLREGPAPSAASVRAVPRDTLTRVVGASARSYRVHLPDGQIGYLDRTAVGAVTTPLRRRRLDAGAELRESPTATAPVVKTADAATEWQVFGRFDDFDWVRGDDGIAGWVAVRTTAPASR